jgi:hypothetical protein
LKKLLIATLIFFGTNASAEDLYKKYDAEWNSLGKYQKEVAEVIFKHAKKDNLQWTATAIAWQESQFGRWQININENDSWDCGMFQNNTKTVAKHSDMPHNRYNKKELCTDLIKSFTFAYLNFAKEVAFWEQVHKGSWRKVWSSYNGGWKGNSEYSEKIATRIQVLKKHMAH